MNSLIACSRQAGKSLIDFGVGISDPEVGQVVVAGQPVWHGVGDLVGLGREALTLDKTAEWFCISEVLLHRRRGRNAGAQFPFVIAAGEVIDLSGTLVEDLFSLVDVGEYSLIAALGDEAIETGVLGCNVDFFFK